MLIPVDRNKANTAIVIAYSIEKDANGKEKAYFYTIDGNSADQVRIKRVPMVLDRLVGFGVNGGSSNGVVPEHFVDEFGKVF